MKSPVAVRHHWRSPGADRPGRRTVRRVAPCPNPGMPTPGAFAECQQGRLGLLLSEIRFAIPPHGSRSDSCLVGVRDIMTRRRISGNTVNTVFVHGGGDLGTTGLTGLLFHGGLEAGGARRLTKLRVALTRPPWHCSGT